MNISIADAKAKFADLIRRAEAGEAITVTRHGKPVAEIVAASPEEEATLIGALKGQITMSEDFDAPFSDFEAALSRGVEP